MMNTTAVNKEYNLLETLKGELEFRHIEPPTDLVLKAQIKRAIGEINRCRHFTPTEDRLYDEKYEDLIIPLCVYALSKIGIEGEISHSENGVQRIYTSGDDYPIEILSKIIPLVK